MHFCLPEVKKSRVYKSKLCFFYPVANNLGPRRSTLLNFVESLTVWAHNATGTLATTHPPTLTIHPPPSTLMGSRCYA